MAYPLFCAIQSGDVERVKLCLETCSNINHISIQDWKRPDTPLIMAAMRGELEITKMLLEKGCLIELADKDNYTAFMWATVKQHLEVTELLIEHGCNKEVIDRHNYTSLMKAAEHGHTEVTKLLLKYKTRTEDVDADNDTALMFAAGNGNLEVTKLLLDNNCNKEAVNIYEYTAFVIAAENGHLQVCRLLIDSGCNKDAVEMCGNTALHMAADSGHLEVTKMLVEYGRINSLIKNNEGKTAYDLAASRKYRQYKEVMKYLQTVMENQLQDANKTPSEKIVKDDIVPAEIRLMADKKSVPLYMKLLESGSEKKRDIRIVLVGQKETGKTSLLKRLFGDDKSMLGEIDSTNGIEIHRITCKANYDDGLWNKLDGKNDETDCDARLLKQYGKKLTSMERDIITAPAHNVIEDLTHVDEFQELEASFQQTIEKSLSHTSNRDLKSLPRVEFEDSFSHSSEASIGHESWDTETNVERLEHKSINLPEVSLSHGQRTNDLLELAYRDIGAMLKSEVDLSDKEDYATLLFWDFAGDEEFYHTHQTFLSQDAIYIVVTKLNDADDKYAQGLFRLWMDSIHCYCRLGYDGADSSTTTDDLDPPVVIVGTWKDAVTIESADTEDACIKNLLKFTKDVADDERRHIRNTFFVSNTEDNNNVFQNIRQYIFNLARTMKTWNKDYPLKFIQLEKRLREKKKELPIISFHEVQHISTETPNPLDTEELMLFLKFHHEIRSLVYFEDLPDYIILDTQWLSDAFKCIVTAKKFRAVSIKNQALWEDYHTKGKLHSKVLEDIFEKEQNIMYTHKDYVLNVMEKFDIIILPIESESYVSDEKTCYYVPCMIKAEPDGCIYDMFNVTENTCVKSTWLFFKFKFLPPHLFNHLIASLSREYKVAEVGVTKEEKGPVISGQSKKSVKKHIEWMVALFKRTAVFELQKITKLSKLVVNTYNDVIQIQILEFGESAIIKRGMYKHIADIVSVEIDKIVRGRFKMTNVNYEKKWKCGLTLAESVEGFHYVSEEQITEFYCETCTRTHRFVGEWSDVKTEIPCVS
ncbi:uncharacterized protein LOC143054607 isoform X1 [Mytilus galloprovincialis]|uniref:uncharacterized protein LOC143054607 isoform X1 n=1 Tax=Mytilus galloprovincialis TaxID=29158 RepID=UPI003F7B90F8